MSVFLLYDWSSAIIVRAIELRLSERLFSGRRERVQASNSTGCGSEVAADCTGSGGDAGEPRWFFPQGSGEKKMSEVMPAENKSESISGGKWCFVARRFTEPLLNS